MTPGFRKFRLALGWKIGQTICIAEFPDNCGKHLVGGQPRPLAAHDSAIKCEEPFATSKGKRLAVKVWLQVLRSKAIERFDNCGIPVENRSADIKDKNFGDQDQHSD